MNPILIRSYNLFFGWQQLAAVRTVVTVTITFPASNQGICWFRLAPTGPIVGIMWPGMSVTLQDVDISKFWVRGAAGDLLLVCGSAIPLQMLPQATQVETSTAGGGGGNGGAES